MNVMPLATLNLPPYEFRIREEGDSTQIFDEVRKKWLVLTPEEWVRQNLVMYLHHYLQYPLSLLEIEKGLRLNGQVQRADLVVSTKEGAPIMLIECKAPEIKVDQSVLDQVARYNITYKVPYLVVSNGVRHFCCHVDLKTKQWKFLQSIPDYPSLVSFGEAS